MTPQHYRLVIVGSGFSAAALSIHLCRHQPSLVGDMAIIGPGQLGAGGAYGTENPDFRLNVRAELMRLFPDNPSDFAEWATTNISDPEAKTPQGAFYRRRDFRRYLQAQVKQAMSGQNYEHITHRVTSLRPIAVSQQGARWQLSCDSGHIINAECVVLATGNPEPRWQCAVEKELHTHSQLVENPWPGRWAERVMPDDNVCLVGGGLTAMDALHCLYKQNHRGKIWVVTPHGTLPPPQTNWQQIPAAKWPEGPVSASSFLGFMRQTLGRDMSSTHGMEQEWQERFESLRVGLNQHWRALSAPDKRRLMRHMGGAWMLSRFRSAPHTFSSAEKLAQSGQLQIIKDRVTSLSAQGEDMCVALASAKTLYADYVINCAGSAEDPLCRHLISKRLMSACAFSSGPEINNQHMVLDSQNRAYQTLFALGAMTKGSAGDVVGAGTTASHAHHLAQYVITVLKKIIYEDIGH